MFQFLKPYAKLQRAYLLSVRFNKPLTLLGWGVTATALIWGLMYAPADYQQGDSFRLIYVHVPMALGSMAGYFAMALCAFTFTIWRFPLSAVLVKAIAPIGALYTFLALVTGAIWGKPMWGAWWVWDARLTSELVLLFIYLAVIALYHAFENEKQADAMVSLFAIVGVINLPIIHFSVEWWQTLHQGATITRFAKPAMDSAMLWPLILSLIGFATVFWALVMSELKHAIIEREKHRPWLREHVMVSHKMEREHDAQ